MPNYSELSVEARSSIYRQYAQEAVSSAQASNKVSDTALYLSIAIQWLRLAGIVESWTVVPLRPVVSEAGGRQAA